MSSSLVAPDAWRAPSKEQLDAIYPKIESLYRDLHSNPELSLHEEQTAATIADQLRRLGFDVTTGIGGTGVVGVLRNGAGPTVMLRAELDALPVPEKTGLPYASHVKTTDNQGIEVPVAHACGHWAPGRRSLAFYPVPHSHPENGSFNGLPAGARGTRTGGSTTNL
jgi:metal-dependent amidase/aminoacylase/carboxypeptidase family protein